MLQGLALKGGIWRNGQQKTSENSEVHFLWLIEDLEHPTDFNIHP